MKYDKKMLVLQAFRLIAVSVCMWATINCVHQNSPIAIVPASLSFLQFILFLGDIKKMRK